MDRLERFSIDTSRAKSNAPVVSYCAQKLGIKEFAVPRTDGHNCNIYWHNVVYSDMKNVVKGGGLVNKFPGMTELAKKVSLTQAIHSMRKLFPAEYDFYPRSWILPAQLDSFQNYCQRHRNSGEEKCFIVKPNEGAQGTGIYLIHSDEQLKESTSTTQLVQEYVADPYLLPDELKFDLRVYALIKSINPLSIYVAREGMARFCTEKYVRPNAANFGNLYAHLTNYTLNKANDSYVHSESLRAQLRGSKRLLSTVFHQMEHKGVRTRRLWREIKLIIAKTVLAMVPEIMLNYEHHFGELKGSASPQCFQIMGFDILIKRNGQPILLEVNSAPSLSVGHSLAQIEANSSGISKKSTVGSATDQLECPSVRSIVDEMIKVPLVRDCLLLVLNQLDSFYPPLKQIRRNETEQKVLTKSGVETTNWDIQSLDTVGTGWITNGWPINSEDDLGLLTMAQRPHLSEIFPSRYGEVSRHLLVLDRAVYLYLQFVPIRHSLLISLPTLKSFLRKCELNDIFSFDDLEAKFNVIYQYFDSTGKTVTSSGATALPFHGFLQLFFLIAERKFPTAGSKTQELLPSVMQLFGHCDSALRRYGVRSTRLRHIVIMEEDEETEPNRQDENNGGGIEKRSVLREKMSIYLLPSRIPKQALDPPKPIVEATQKGPLVSRRKRAKTLHQPSRTRSVPRKFGATA